MTNQDTIISTERMVNTPMIHGLATIQLTSTQLRASVFGIDFFSISTEQLKKVIISRRILHINIFIGYFNQEYRYQSLEWSTAQGAKWIELFRSIGAEIQEQS